MSRKLNEQHWQDLQEVAVREAIKIKTKIKALTKGQQRFLDAIDRHTVTLCDGPAGSGKSFCALAKALEALHDNRVQRIIITKPLVQCGRGYGFLPGEKEDKMRPFMRPLIETMEEQIGKEEVMRLMAKEAITFCPLDDMRGLSLRGTFLLLDEAQNALRPQLRMFLTRFGLGSKVVVIGDVEQSDVADPLGNSFEWLLDRLDGINKEIGIVELDKSDIVRHPLLQCIDTALSY